jgi:hypothetical protein
VRAGEVDLPRDFSLTRPNQKGKISEARQSKAKSSKRRAGGPVPPWRGTFILRSTSTLCSWLPRGHVLVRSAALVDPLFTELLPWVLLAVIH